MKCCAVNATCKLRLSSWNKQHMWLSTRKNLSLYKTSRRASKHRVLVTSRKRLGDSSAPQQQWSSFMILHFSTLQLSTRNHPCMRLLRAKFFGLLVPFLHGVCKFTAIFTSAHPLLSVTTFAPGCSTQILHRLSLQSEAEASRIKPAQCRPGVAALQSWLLICRSSFQPIIGLGIWRRREDETSFASLAGSPTFIC
jgi:hypothetical protein